MSGEDDSELLKRIENIESILKEYLSFKSLFGDYDKVMRNYLKLIDMFLTYGKITPSVLMGEKMDSITENILEILFNLEAANISQITDGLRKERGSASRTTVRKKILELEERGIIESTGEMEKRYRISQEVISRWLKMVGMDMSSGADKVNR